MSANTATASAPTETNNFPIWMRLPATVEQFGISRTKLYQLAKAGKIRSVALTEPGQTKATRLFDPASVNAYIESFLEEPNNTTAKQ